jgi:iron(III) transport system ATP-binding protein
MTGSLERGETSKRYAQPGPDGQRGAFWHNVEMTSGVELRHAVHRYGRQAVLDNLDLEVERGSFVAVLGESGSGKTTLLRVIAGFERLESGLLRIGGVDVDDGRRAVAPEKRKVGYVPQDGALFPHLRVEANVAFGLGRHRDRSRVAELLEMVGLSGMEKRFPHELSGGQQQRVALARALAVDPDVVLLDEPFSALDAALRISLRREVSSILRAHGSTTVLVTHDQDEALSMADRVAVLRQGRVIVSEGPEDLYRSPVDAEMARFLGEANLLPGRTIHGSVVTALGRLILQDGLAATLDASGPDVTVLVRPEQVEVRTRHDAPSSGGIAARVVERAYFGHDAVLEVLPDRSAEDGLAVGPLLVRVTGGAAPGPGAEVLLTVRGQVMAWASRAEPGNPA